MRLEEFVAIVEGRLVVSCQAGSGSPLRDTPTLVRIAQSAVAGGAAAVRCGGVGGVADVAAIAAAINVPVIGLTKEGTSDVYITPTVGSALAVLRAGANVVAVDATGRPRPDGSTLEDTVVALHSNAGLVMADVSTWQEGIDAASAGADIIASTLSGYTPYSSQGYSPDLDLIRELRKRLPSVVILAEGRYHTPDLAAAALDAGATAVVVGTAITDPGWITSTFANRLASSRATSGTL